MFSWPIKWNAKFNYNMFTILKISYIHCYTQLQCLYYSLTLILNEILYRNWYGKKMSFLTKWKNHHDCVRIVKRLVMRF